MQCPILGVRRVEIECSDLVSAARFYSDVWNLRAVERTSDSIYFRGTARYHSILSLHQGSGPQIRRLVLDVGTADEVRGLHDALKKAGLSTQSPAPLNEPGGGFGFGFVDEEGRHIALCSNVSDHESLPDAIDQPRKIAHVNLNAVDIEKTNKLFTDVLGFKLIDHSGPLHFLHCKSSDHASIVTGSTGQPTINHVAFELPTWESVMRGAGRMRDAGYPIEWGVGRHGAGNNVFAYFAGPDEMPLEYTAEVAQIDDSYVPHGPDYWRFPPGRLDQWGITPPHTARWKRIQNMHAFAKGDFALRTMK